MPKFRPDLYARFRNIAEKQVPAKLKPIVDDGHKNNGICVFYYMQLKEFVMLFS